MIEIYAGVLKLIKAAISPKLLAWIIQPYTLLYFKSR